VWRQEYDPTVVFTVVAQHVRSIQAVASWDAGDYLDRSVSFDDNDVVEDSIFPRHGVTRRRLQVLGLLQSEDNQMNFNATVLGVDDCGKVKERLALPRWRIAAKIAS
jgi:hypothetical protein